jgi:hypothetical protein
LSTSRGVFRERTVELLAAGLVHEDCSAFARSGDETRLRRLTFDTRGLDRERSKDTHAGTHTHTHTHTHVSFVLRGKRAVVVVCEPAAENSSVAWAPAVERASCAVETGNARRARLRPACLFCVLEGYRLDRRRREG